MEFLNNWTYTVCITLIASVIFSLLLPKGGHGKVGKIVITVFIIISFVTPFVGGQFNLDFGDFFVNDKSEQTIKENSYENIIKTNIENLLTQGSFENSKAEVKVDLKDDEIYIKSADVYIQDEYDKDKVKDYVFEKLGINAKVYYIGE